MGHKTVVKVPRAAGRVTTLQACCPLKCSHRQKDGCPNGLSLVSCAEAYLVTCLLKESPPRAKEFSCLLGVHRNDLAKAFRKAGEPTLSKFLKREQIRAAKRLLTTTSFDAGRIAYLAAFGSRRTFFRAFRRAVGVTPGVYRRSAKCP